MSQSAQRSKPTLRHRFRRLLFIALMLYLLTFVGVAVFQRRLIYFPEVFASGTLDEMAKSAGLERWENSTGQIIGWKRMSQARPAQGQLLITHGNAGCAIDRSDYITPIQQSAALDVFIVEYPGYGDRPGSPSQRTLFESAEEAFQLLATNGPVYLVGESLGSGVAAHLAGNHPTNIAGVLLVAPYNTLVDVAQHHMPIFPVRWVLRDRFLAEEYLQHYRGPVAVLIAGEDQVVPAKFGRRLYDGYAGQKRLWESAQADHNSVHAQEPEFWKQVIEFWQTNRPSSMRE